MDASLAALDRAVQLINRFISSSVSSPGSAAAARYGSVDKAAERGKWVTIKARGTGRAAAAQSDVPGRALAAYLALPVEEYSLLDPDWVERSAADPSTFRVTIPLRELSGVDLQPSVAITVAADPATGRVSFRGERACVGDPALDARFCLMGGVEEVVRGDSGAASEQGRDGRDAAIADLDGVREPLTADARLLQESQADEVGSSSAAPATHDLAAAVRVRLDMWVAPPLDAVPGPLLGSAGGLLLRLLLQALLPSFLEMLVGGGKKAEEEDRFKYDFANSRWVRVKPEKDADGKYTSGNWEKGDATIITPKSGTPYTVWPVIHAKLTRRRLKSVPPGEAERLMAKGATMLDVRPAYQFERERVAGAVNVPMFRKVAGNGPWDNAKKVVMRFGLAMEATERDPDFAKNAAEVLNKRKKVIVYCGRGGTIKVGAQPWAPGRKYFKDDPEKMFGIESRSLKACHELLEAGFKDVVHLEGGLSLWRYGGFPVDGK
ncbi:hypothetical protein WJX81_005977 [Elliptochloris bilobata]|uniref:Rhodanese domain-containing protein n=1 Tax=Elliptochloris bilobata TaxID=381761 RepID=A0AAW1SIW3_9CHLO